MQSRDLVHLVYHRPFRGNYLQNEIVTHLPFTVEKPNTSYSPRPAGLIKKSFKRFKTYFHLLFFSLLNRALCWLKVKLHIIHFSSHNAPPICDRQHHLLSDVPLLRYLKKYLQKIPWKYASIDWVWNIAACIWYTIDCVRTRYLQLFSLWYPEIRVEHLHSW